MTPSFATFPREAGREIRLLVLDVDGVLTDGRIVMTDAGDEIKAFNVRDGHGIKMLQRAGVEVAILTGRSSEVVRHRAAELGIRHVVQGSLRKADGIERLLAGTGLTGEVCAYMGDDVIDLPAMRRCRMALAPADAHPAVLAQAHWRAGFGGGAGAVRQAAEGLILAAGQWETVIGEPYGVTPDDCGWAA